MQLRHFLNRLCPYRRPTSATAKGWRLWEEATRQAHPVAWFIFETCLAGAADVLRYQIVRPASCLKWWLVHRVCPPHRYHMVNTGLKPGYHDAREQLLHASFAILVAFVERQQRQGHVNWDADEGHAHAWAEMRTLATWWCHERPQREQQLPKWPAVGVPLFEHCEPEYAEREDVRECKRVGDRIATLEAAFHAEDEAMLIRLAQVRLALWD